MSDLSHRKYQRFSRLRTALFWVIMQCVVDLLYNNPEELHGGSLKSWISHLFSNRKLYFCVYKS